ncbi:MAG: M48 family metalloprotease [Gemmatimonadota bacterium]
MKQPRCGPAWGLPMACVFLAGCSGQLGSLSGLPGAESLQSLARVGASALPISTEAEITIGRTVAGTVVGREPLLQNEELHSYVELVGQVVAEQSVRRGELVFYFGILDTPEVNAYAAPGGYIFVTRGTLELLETEAELAAILAHEIAHVDARHVVEELRQGDMLRTAREEADLTGPLLDRVAGAGTSLLFTGLSRGDEMEADSLGLLYAAGAGYQPAAFIRALERMELAEGAADADQRFRTLRTTHPPTGDRIEALRRGVDALPPDYHDGVELAERFQVIMSGLSEPENTPSG